VGQASEVANLLAQFKSPGNTKVVQASKKFKVLKQVSFWAVKIKSYECTQFKYCLFTGVNRK